MVVGTSAGSRRSGTMLQPPPCVVGVGIGLGIDDHAVVDQHLDQLLDEERVAVGPFHDQVAHPAGGGSPPGAAARRRPTPRWPRRPTARAAWSGGPPRPPPRARAAGWRRRRAPDEGPVAGRRGPGQESSSESRSAQWRSSSTTRTGSVAEQGPQVRGQVGGAGREKPPAPRRRCDRGAGGEVEAEPVADQLGLVGTEAGGEPIPQLGGRRSPAGRCRGSRSGRRPGRGTCRRRAPRRVAVARALKK